MRPSLKVAVTPWNPDSKVQGPKQPWNLATLMTSSTEAQRAKHILHGRWRLIRSLAPNRTWDLRCGVHARFKHGCAHKSSIVTPRNCQVPCCHRSQQQLKAPSTCNSPLVWNQKRWDQPMEPWQFRRCFGMIGSQSGNANKMLPSARNYLRIFCISTSKNKNSGEVKNHGNFFQGKVLNIEAWLQKQHFQEWTRAQ